MGRDAPACSGSGQPASTKYLQKYIHGLTIVSIGVWFALLVGLWGRLASRVSWADRGAIEVQDDGRFDLAKSRL